MRLASVNTPDQVPVAVADALGMPMDGAAATRDLRDRLISFLSRRRMLLLVDNCEHVVDAAAVLIDDILSRCPGITVLATSREALAVPDEVQVTVGPLETPPEDTPPGEVLAYPAAQLFAERARAVRPGLLFDADNLTAIGAITRSLDGIPLALELAAARVSTLSPVEVSATARGPVHPAHLRRPHRRGSGSRRCAPPSTGATSCCPRPSSGCSTGSRSSRAGGR